jgi:hypothetical protein
MGSSLSSAAARVDLAATLDCHGTDPVLAAERRTDPEDDAERLDKPA